MWRMANLASKLITVGYLATALPAMAEPDLRLVVNRLDDSVEIYAALRADAMPNILQADPAGLAAPDGRVYYGELRTSGTFEFGDTMVDRVGFSAGGLATEIEAMSVMVHPEANFLPFETPIDGVIAMSVCTVPDPEVPPQISELRLYSGFIAYPVNGFDALSLDLPHDKTIEVELVSFVDGVEDTRETQLLAPGDPMVFEQSARASWAERLGLAWLWQD